MESGARDATEAALRSMLSHLDAHEGAEVTRRIVATASRIFSRDVPSLAWTVALAEALPTMNEAELDSFIEGDEARKPHYYQPIVGLVWALSRTAFMYLELRRRRPLFGEPTLIVVDVVSTLSSWYRDKRRPDEYLYWWARSNWHRAPEGPRPPLGHGPSLENTGNAILPEPIKVVVNEATSWLRDRLEANHEGV